MKAFIDRCCGLVHGLILEGKYGALVETPGSGNDVEVLNYMKRFAGTLGSQSTGGIGSSPRYPMPLTLWKD
jgi:multimeric flavodoxin WrbA